jgi:hypothetical protein|uniref:Uncharacterized protein n=1 Tax=viral metagenome TaxID=1070528 RepID=A0A6C0DV04_9ZZZZ
MNIDFQKEFIDIPFDTLLEQHNSSLINSNDLYLNYKQLYLKQTRENYEIYKNENTILQDLRNINFSSNENNTKFNFTFIDNNQYQKQKQNVKNIILKQRDLYNRFDHYVNVLIKTHKHKTRSIKSIDKKSRSFSLFSKTLKKK